MLNTLLTTGIKYNNKFKVSYNVNIANHIPEHVVMSKSIHIHVIMIYNMYDQKLLVGFVDIIDVILF